MPARVFFLGTEYFLGGRIEFGNASFAIGDDHRIIERIDNSFSGLLGHHEFAHIRVAQLPNSLSHAVIFDGQQTQAQQARATADAQAQASYAARNAALAARSKSLDQRAKAISTAEGQIQSSTISSDGVYVVGKDIPPGTYHTTGDGGQTASLRPKVTDTVMSHLLGGAFTGANGIAAAVIALPLRGRASRG